MYIYIYLHREEMWDFALMESESYWLEDKKVKEIVRADIVTRTEVRIEVNLYIYVYIYIYIYM
jgi:hypothetical protein